MQKTILIITLLLSSILGFAQNNESGYGDILPVGFSDDERRYLQEGNFALPSSRGIETPPPYDNLRNMAEWEEVQSLNISWSSYPGILKQIVEFAILETQVIILTDDSDGTMDFLEDPNEGSGAITDFSNITIIEAEPGDEIVDSIWARDFSGNPVYGNEVDDLIMVDWIYNRPNRPNDDASPALIAEELGLELYCLTDSPTDLVNTGGNWMTDGFGTGFASELILAENEPGNEYGVSAKTADEIDDIVMEWLGVHTYVKMETLPFDQIHHIDMHMKLIDEQTMLVGEFPEGMSDGPQIVANMEFVLSNYTNKWGEPYKIEWIPMPPATNGSFPDGTWGGASYRTYTNSVFVNNTVIVPTYREEYDTTALAIYADLLPGFNVVGIDCDNQPEPIINASGAIHCITHTVGVEDPLLISHNVLQDTESTEDHLVSAYVKHRSGISGANMFWRLAGETDYVVVTMSDAGDDYWEAIIPGHPVGSTIQYYVEGTAVSGKMQTRPMPAPEAYWEFDVVDNTVNTSEGVQLEIAPIYPNPASSITVIPVTNNVEGQGQIRILDMLGRDVMAVHKGLIPRGEKKYFFDACTLATGTYIVKVETTTTSSSQKFLVK